MRFKVATVSLLLCAAVLGAACSVSTELVPQRPASTADDLRDELLALDSTTEAFVALQPTYDNVQTIGDMYSTVEALAPEVDEALDGFAGLNDRFRAYLAADDLPVDEKDLNSLVDSLDAWLESQRIQNDSSLCFDTLPSGAMRRPIDELGTYRDYADCLADFLSSDDVRDGVDAAGRVISLASDLWEQLP
jgi:hypothetical protein